MLTDQEKLTYMHISDVRIVEMIMKRASNIFLLFPPVSQANSLLTQSEQFTFLDVDPCYYSRAANSKSQNST